MQLLQRRNYHQQLLYREGYPTLCYASHLSRALQVAQQLCVALLIQLRNHARFKTVTVHETYDLSLVQSLGLVNKLMAKLSGESTQGPEYLK